MTTNQRPTNGQFDYTLKKQTGGPGQFARVIGRIESCDELFLFENQVTGGAIPSPLIKAAEKGFRDATSNGVLAGYPVIGVKVILEDGNYHPIDSTERAFYYAAHQGFYQGLRNADSVIIEPIMNVTIEIPTTFVGLVQGDLRSRRGIVQSLETILNGEKIQANVPLAEMFGYATRIRSLCSGQGIFSMEFSHYEPVPEKIQPQLMAKYAHSS